MDPRLKTALRALLVLLWVACGIGLLWLSLHDLDLGRLTGGLGEAALWPLALAIVFDVVCVALKGAKWRVILSPLGRPGIFRLQAAFYAAGATAMVLPFRLDEFVRAFVAHRLTRLPGASLLGSMALERLIDFLALLAALLLLALAVPLPDWLATAPRIIVVIVLILAVVLVALQLSARRPAGSGLLSRLVVGLAEGGSALRRPHLMAAGAGLAVLEWVGNVAVVVCVLAAFGLELPWHGALLLTVLSMVSYALPLAPAGIGVFEVACRLALPELYGVEPEAAVGVALAIHALLLLPMAVIGTSVVVAVGVSLRKVGSWGRAQMAEGEASADDR